MSAQTDLTVTFDTKVGKINGKVFKYGEKYVAEFLGIPYAKQPVGQLRLKPLEPLEQKLDHEESPFLAHKPGKSSVQIQRGSFWETKFETGEDCIFLNIYVPLGSNPAEFEKSQENKLPVFFHIHGGGFKIGSGSESTYHLSSFVARHNCIGVNINYRLDMLGFLSFPPAIPHNLGFLDQQFALKWVHENVSGFGGDPERVTIYGCSAGGCSVHYQMLSSESSKYFSRAIASSGTVNKVWSRFTPDAQRKKVMQVMKKLGGPTKNPTDQEVLEFFQNLPLDTIRQFITENILNPNLGFAPVDEFEGEAEPSKKQIARKPFLLGSMSQEGSMFSDMFFQRKDNTTSTWSRQVFGEYFGEKTFYEPLRNLLKELVTVSEMPLYVYLFDYKCPTRGELLPETEVPVHYGSFHSLDIPFLFNLAAEGSDFLPSSEADIQVNSTCAKMMGAFIKSEDLSDFPLKRYEMDNEAVNRISEEGLTVIEKECLMPKRRCLCFKTTTAATVLKISPNKF